MAVPGQGPEQDLNLGLGWNPGVRGLFSVGEGLNSVPEPQRRKEGEGEKEERRGGRAEERAL